MWRRLSLLILCCAVTGLDDAASDKAADPSPEKTTPTVETGVRNPEKDAPSAATVQNTLLGGELPSPSRAAPVVGAEGSVMQSPAESLEDELDNQENIISQLLGDYDKVKTVSSGSDCLCRCIVRPIKRSDCSRISDGDPASPFYTVETVSKGTDCKKCVCMAPPSAVNPCEGEYRFKKLQEASKDDIKLATIIDLLEGSMYGMDLLKLHSVTTKLLTRVDNMEKAFARNLTERAREKERAKERAKEEKEKKAQQKKKKANVLERAGPKSGAAAYANKKKNEGQQKKNQQKDDGPEQQQPTSTERGTAKSGPTASKLPIKDKSSLVVRGVTFYKAEEESYKEEERGKDKRRSSSVTANVSVDLLISDQVPPTRTYQTKNPGFSTTVSSKLDFQDLSRSRAAPTQPPTTSLTTTKQTTATTKTAPTTAKPTSASTTNIPPTTTKLKTTSQLTTATVQPTAQVNLHTTTPSVSSTGPLIVASPGVESRQVRRSRLSWTENPADQAKTTKTPAMCKDTVASISEPVQQNSYGLRDGAWMRDARGHGNVIYLTNGHYGSDLQEFRDMDSFKSGQASNSYKLPYSFTGTGHVVFNGAFYYNRAFSRDVIRYDLRHRYVAAWTTLHDALLEEQVHSTQKTEMEFAVDESGLWLLYPAVDAEGFHQEVILLIHLHHRELQPIRTYRTGLRRGRYGNIFLVCGVLYAVDSMEHLYANVTYAFDTHTLTHTVPSLAFTNMHSHTSQLSYCPLDQKLYAWDDGHQMTYDVVFAY